MGKRLRVFLTQDEDRTLQELRQAKSVPQRVKDRAEAVRLNAQGWVVEKIAQYLAWDITTVRAALNRWIREGLGGLWDEPKPGRPRRITDDDLECVEQWLRQEACTYNAQQLVRRLQQERGVKVSAGHLRRLLKARGIIWKRTRWSHHNCQDPQLRASKQADLETLQQAAQDEEIDLFYMDESGCNPHSEPGYSYFFIGEQKRQEQNQRRGRRVNILGFFQPLMAFFYGLVIGRVTSKNVILLFDEQARQAQESGRMRVIVLDNASIHQSKAFKACIAGWESQGLYLFFLPPYCSEMNPIEVEWNHLKRDEIRGRMFEDELELAYGIMDGLTERGNKHGHKVERFHFQAATAAA